MALEHPLGDVIRIVGFSQFTWHHLSGSISDGVLTPPNRARAIINRHCASEQKADLNWVFQKVPVPVRRGSAAQISPDQLLCGNRRRAPLNPPRFIPGFNVLALAVQSVLVTLLFRRIYAAT